MIRRLKCWLGFHLDQLLVASYPPLFQCRACGARYFPEL